jgi:hypothetical protein
MISHCFQIITCVCSIYIYIFTIASGININQILKLSIASIVVFVVINTILPRLAEAVVIKIDNLLIVTYLK